MEQMDPAKDVGGPSSADQWSSQRLARLLLAGVSVEQWENLLAPDLKRAGPEMFRLMRSTGATSVRDWLSRCFEGPRRSARWWDIWSVATQADSIISSSDNPAQLADVLANSDELEVELRRLAAHVYEARIGDRQGAASMLAVKAPGAHVDIVPSWLVERASQLARSEHFRARLGLGRGRGAGAADERGIGNESKGKGGTERSGSAPAQGQLGRGRGSKVK